MMTRFKKRYMEVEAEQWIPGEPPPSCIQYDTTESFHYVQGEAGRWKVGEGWWVVRGTSGNLYAAPPEDFQKIYESIENQGPEPAGVGAVPGPKTRPPGGFAASVEQPPAV